MAPAFYRSLRDPGFLDDERQQRVRKELAWMNRTVRKLQADPVEGKVEDGLAQFHAAPHWARMAWLRERTPLGALVEEQTALGDWLERAAQIPAVQATLPDREAILERYRQL